MLTIYSWSLDAQEQFPQLFNPKELQENILRHPDEYVESAEYAVKYSILRGEREYKVYTNNEIYLLALRVAIKHQKAQGVEWVYNTVDDSFVCNIDSDGRCDFYQGGHWDLYGKLLRELL